MCVLPASSEDRGKLKRMEWAQPQNIIENGIRAQVILVGSSLLTKFIVRARKAITLACFTLQQVYVSKFRA